MTRKTWASNIATMTGWMREKNLPVIPEELDTLVRYYESNSPESFEMPRVLFEEDSLGLRKLAVGSPPQYDRPQVTDLNIVDLFGEGRLGALICDNRRGVVSWLTQDDGQWTETALTRVNAPVKTKVFDYEGDGDLDVVICGMGYMHPNDDLIGEAHLLLNEGGRNFNMIGLLRGVARITDILPGDFDGDGDTDFVVAKFGWRTTGGLMWLQQLAPGRFQAREILPVNGAMNLEVLDYDGDGDQDFVTLVAQQHESLVLFSNDGLGNFRNSVLIQATHPSYGSSSFEMVDLDQDGDRDILLSNGDMMDENPEWKPYHGVRWFERDGDDYVPHDLSFMPGCYCAKARDMDGDGDLDVVASSLHFFWDEQDFPSLIWLENDGEQNFTKRLLDYAPTNLARFDIGDLDGDGRPDILAGGMHVPGPLDRVGRLTAWLSEAKEAKDVGGEGETASAPSE